LKVFDDDFQGLSGILLGEADFQESACVSVRGAVCTL